MARHTGHGAATQREELHTRTSSLTEDLGEPKVQRAGGSGPAGQPYIAGPQVCMCVCVPVYLTRARARARTRASSSTPVPRPPRARLEPWLRAVLPVLRGEPRVGIYTCACAVARSELTPASVPRPFFPRCSLSPRGLIGQRPSGPGLAEPSCGGGASSQPTLPARRPEVLGGALDGL